MKNNHFNQFLSRIKPFFTRRKKIILIIILFFLVMIMFVTNSGMSHIPPGERGVLFNRLGGGLSNTIMGEGTHFIVPFVQTVYRAKVTRQSAHIERITADSREFQDVAMWLNVEFRLNEDSLPDLFKSFGVKSSRRMIDEYLLPNTNEVTKNIIIDYSINDILSQQKTVKQKIYGRLKEVLSEYYIEVIDVDIENIRLAPAFRDMIAEIEFTSYAKQQADIKLEAAAKEAERRLLEAETRKQEKILEAQGVAEYNILISRQEINPALLEYKQLENSSAAIGKWDGHLPSEMGNVGVWPF